MKKKRKNTNRPHGTTILTTVPSLAVLDRHKQKEQTVSRTVGLIQETALAGT